MPIYIRITSERHKVEISTGSFIKPTDWNTTKHCVKSTADQADKINNSIKSLLSKIHKIHTELVAAEKPFTLEVIKTKLTGKDEKRTTLLNAINYHNGLIEKGIGKNYALNTYKGYLWFTDKIKSFLKYQYNRNDILLTELNHRFLTEFEHYLFHSLHNQVNTVQKNITQLKKVINLCIDLDWLDKMPFKRIKLKAYTPKREHLTAGELESIENINITCKRLQMIRDKFVFQCYTGVAFVDLNRLTANNIVKGIDGENWIILNREKTKSRSTIPLLPIAKTIIEKYRNEDITTLFPLCSNQKFNMYLKELSDLCGINKRITTHTGRRTFATTVTLSNGVPIETVSRMLGHSDLKTTSIYAKVVDTKVSEDMQKVKAKLINVAG
jgi:site-specific recombinase XerD